MEKIEIHFKVPQTFDPSFDLEMGVFKRNEN